MNKLGYKWPPTFKFERQYSRESSYPKFLVRFLNRNNFFTSFDCYNCSNFHLFLSLLSFASKHLRVVFYFGFYTKESRNKRGDALRRRKNQNGVKHFLDEYFKTILYYHQRNISWKQGNIKFIYYEKVTKFEKNLPFSTFLSK